MNRYYSLAAIVIGVIIIFAIFSPIVEYTLWEMSGYTDSLLIGSSTSNVLGVSIDGTQPQKPTYAEFYMTIPRLNLKNEKVIVGSNDFDKDLAQLPGSALPGEQGNVFVSGHSSIPLLAILDGKKAIFNNLHYLGVGDQIKIQVLGQEFNYQVAGTKIVSPKDVDVVNPPDSTGRYLTLMTCEPPGFNTKRLVVLAKLEGG